MRRTVMFAAMLAALAMAPPPAEAGDRGVGFRHFSPHAGAKFHRPHRGLKFDQRGLAGRHPHFKPRRLRHFSQGGLVLKFGGGDFVLKVNPVPHFEHHRFGRRHGHRGLSFGFNRLRHFRPRHQPGFAVRDRHDLLGHLGDFRQGLPRSEGGRGGGVHGGAPPEALLERLEQLGFRDVPELLRKQSR